MSKRNYNVFFNTHTVSGIVISVALYIIFFAGAFALFRDEINIWQEAEFLEYTAKEDIDYDTLLKTLDERYDLRGRDVQLRLGGIEDKISISLSAQKDSIDGAIKKREFFFIDTHTLEEKRYDENYGLGEFLYRLHFFSQIPYIGIYLAGLVALFFLFAIVTGVIVHWKKIISNFYHFNPKTTLKRIWTDAHTALGIIGLPYQFIFAVTGAYFGLSLLVLLPANFLYEGDREKLIGDMRPSSEAIEWTNLSTEKGYSLNASMQETASLWSDSDCKINRCFIKNYAGEQMKYIILGEMDDSKRFIGIGRVVVDGYTGEKYSIKNPNEFNYLEDSQRLVGRLHFANFGGYAMKFVYFLLAFVTCFVIITGVLIWIEARNKKSMSYQQRFFTAKVGHIYLAITLGLLPVTALSFHFVKLTKDVFVNNMNAIYVFYFTIWLLFIFYYRFKRNNYFVNKSSLLLGGILGILVPVTNGIVSNNWIWNTFKNSQTEILIVDLIWIVIALLAFYTYSKIKPTIKEQSSFTKNPLDFNSRKSLIDTELQKIKEEETTIETSEENILKDKNELPMKTKIIFLWFFLAIGWIVHHMYGLFNIYYNETLVMEVATGEPPMIHHIYRILFEGICLLFALLTIELSKKWFKLISLVWASIAGLYNVYHFIEAILHEPSNISEIFMLLLVSIASIFLVTNIYKWKKD